MALKAPETAARGDEAGIRVGCTRASRAPSEAFAIAREITGREAQINYVEQARVGDHQWYISDMARFREHYPEWQMTYDVPAILREIYDANVDKWTNS